MTDLPLANCATACGPCRHLRISPTGAAANWWSIADQRL